MRRNSLAGRLVAVDFGDVSEQIGEGRRPASEVDPRDGNIAQRSLSNWFCDDGGGYRCLPNLPDTPVDRHTYAQFAFAPTTQSLYMVGGAAARFAEADRPWDFWRFSFAAGTWTKMPETYPGADQCERPV